VFREHAIQSMSGTSGRQRVQNDVLSKFLVCVPTKTIASAFGEVVSAIQMKIAANHEFAHNLAANRDTLLPRLISGQLRLPEAESLLETA
jgi:type I restriction enzyme S subunit